MGEGDIKPAEENKWTPEKCGEIFENDPTYCATKTSKPDKKPGAPESKPKTGDSSYTDESKPTTETSGPNQSTTVHGDGVEKAKDTLGADANGDGKGIDLKDPDQLEEAIKRYEDKAMDCQDDFAKARPYWEKALELAKKRLELANAALPKDKDAIKHWEEEVTRYEKKIELVEGLTSTDPVNSRVALTRANEIEWLLTYWMNKAAKTTNLLKASEYYSKAEEYARMRLKEPVLNDKHKAHWDKFVEFSQALALEKKALHYAGEGNIGNAIYYGEKRLKLTFDKRLGTDKSSWKKLVNGWNKKYLGVSYKNEVDVLAGYALDAESRAKLAENEGKPLESIDGYLEAAQDGRKIIRLLESSGKTVQLRKWKQWVAKWEAKLKQLTPALEQKIYKRLADAKAETDPRKIYHINVDVIEWMEIREDLPGGSAWESRRTALQQKNKDPEAKLLGRQKKAGDHKDLAEAKAADAEKVTIPERNEAVNKKWPWIETIAKQPENKDGLTLNQRLWIAMVANNLWKHWKTIKKEGERLQKIYDKKKLYREAAKNGLVSLGLKALSDKDRKALRANVDQWLKEADTDEFTVALEVESEARKYYYKAKAIAHKDPTQAEEYMEKAIELGWVRLEMSFDPPKSSNPEKPVTKSEWHDQIGQWTLDLKATRELRASREIYATRLEVIATDKAARARRLNDMADYVSDPKEAQRLRREAREEWRGATELGRQRLGLCSKLDRRSSSSEYGKWAKQVALWAEATDDVHIADEVRNPQVFESNLRYDAYSAHLHKRKLSPKDREKWLKAAKAQRAQGNSEPERIILGRVKESYQLDRDSLSEEKRKAAQAELKANDAKVAEIDKRLEEINTTGVVDENGNKIELSRTDKLELDQDGRNVELRKGIERAEAMYNRSQNETQRKAIRKTLNHYQQKEEQYLEVVALTAKDYKQRIKALKQLKKIKMGKDNGLVVWNQWYAQNSSILPNQQRFEKGKLDHTDFKGLPFIHSEEKSLELIAISSKDYKQREKALKQLKKIKMGKKDGLKVWNQWYAKNYQYLPPKDMFEKGELDQSHYQGLPQATVHDRQALQPQYLGKYGDEFAEGILVKIIDSTLKDLPGVALEADGDKITLEEYLKLEEKQREMVETVRSAHPHGYQYAFHEKLPSPFSDYYDPDHAEGDEHYQPRASKLRQKNAFRIQLNSDKLPPHVREYMRDVFGLFLLTTAEKPAESRYRGPGDIVGQFDNTSLIGNRARYDELLPRNFRITRSGLVTLQHQLTPIVNDARWKIFNGKKSVIEEVFNDDSWSAVRPRLIEESFADMTGNKTVLQEVAKIEKVMAESKALSWRKELIPHNIENAAVYLTTRGNVLARAKKLRSEIKVELRSQVDLGAPKGVINAIITDYDNVDALIKRLERPYKFTAVKGHKSGKILNFGPDEIKKHRRHFDTYNVPPNETFQPHVQDTDTDDLYSIIGELETAEEYKLLRKVTAEGWNNLRQSEIDRAKRLRKRLLAEKKALPKIIKEKKKAFDEAIEAKSSEQNTRDCNRTKNEWDKAIKQKDLVDVELLRVENAIEQLELSTELEPGQRIRSGDLSLGWLKDHTEVVAAVEYRFFLRNNRNFRDEVAQMPTLELPGDPPRRRTKSGISDEENAKLLKAKQNQIDIRNAKKRIKGGKNGSKLSDKEIDEIIAKQIADGNFVRGICWSEKDRKNQKKAYVYSLAVRLTAQENNLKDSGMSLEFLENNLPVLKNINDDLKEEAFGRFVDGSIMQLDSNIKVVKEGSSFLWVKKTIYQADGKTVSVNNPNDLVKEVRQSYVDIRNILIAAEAAPTKQEHDRLYAIGQGLFFRNQESRVNDDLKVIVKDAAKWAKYEGYVKTAVVIAAAGTLSLLTGGLFSTVGAMAFGELSILTSIAGYLGGGLGFVWGEHAFTKVYENIDNGQGLYGALSGFAEGTAHTFTDPMTIPNAISMAAMLRLLKFMQIRYDNSLGYLFNNATKWGMSRAGAMRLIGGPLGGLSWTANKAFNFAYEVEVFQLWGYTEENIRNLISTYTPLYIMAEGGPTFTPFTNTHHLTDPDVIFEGAVNLMAIKAGGPFGGPAHRVIQKHVLTRIQPIIARNKKLGEKWTDIQKKVDDATTEWNRIQSKIDRVTTDFNTHLVGEIPAGYEAWRQAQMNKGKGLKGRIKGLFVRRHHEPSVAEYVLAQRKAVLLEQNRFYKGLSPDHIPWVAKALHANEVLLAEHSRFESWHRAEQKVYGSKGKPIPMDGTVKKVNDHLSVRYNVMNRKFEYKGKGRNSSWKEIYHGDRIEIKGRTYTLDGDAIRVSGDFGVKVEHLTEKGTSPNGEPVEVVTGSYFSYDPKQGVKLVEAFMENPTTESISVSEHNGVITVVTRDPSGQTMTRRFDPRAGKAENIPKMVKKANKFKPGELPTVMPPGTDQPDELDGVWRDQDKKSQRKAWLKADKNRKEVESELDAYYTDGKKKTPEGFKTFRDNFESKHGRAPTVKDYLWARYRHALQREKAVLDKLDADNPWVKQQFEFIKSELADIKYVKRAAKSERDIFGYKDGSKTAIESKYGVKATNKARTEFSYEANLGVELVDALATTHTTDRIEVSNDGVIRVIGLSPTGKQRRTIMQFKPKGAKAPDVKAMQDRASKHEPPKIETETQSDHKGDAEDIPYAPWAEMGALPTGHRHQKPTEAKDEAKGPEPLQNEPVVTDDVGDVYSVITAQRPGEDIIWNDKVYAALDRNDVSAARVVRVRPLNDGTGRVEVHFDAYEYPSSEQIRQTPELASWPWERKKPTLNEVMVMTLTAEQAQSLGIKSRGKNSDYYYLHPRNKKKVELTDSDTMVDTSTGQGSDKKSDDSAGDVDPSADKKDKKKKEDDTIVDVEPPTAREDKKKKKKEDETVVAKKPP